MACLDDKLAHGLAAGTLDEAASAEARRHIDTCDSCRDLVAAVATTADTAPAPEVIGRYEIIGVLGSGAMGVVYEAKDPQLERRVAIKLLRGDAHRDRLLREARAAAQISHPNVIAVFDAGIADDEVFMAMELIRGRTLRQWLADKQRTWREIVDVCVKAGRGLAAIHRAGLVHRDVKPDNILVADDGRIVVTDLGLVRAEAGDSPIDGNAPIDLTQTGTLLGTPAYAAPEQLEGPRDIDARSDQFGYCVSAYEALAGARPFDGATLSGLRDAIDRGPAALDRADVPARIKTAIARGLAAEPAKRWPSMDDLVDELADVLAPKRRTAWIAVGALGLALASGVTFYVAARARVPGPSCTLGASTIAADWNPQVRAALERAFSASRVPYATSNWTAAAKLLDGYAAQWASAYDEACTATHVKKMQSAVTLDLRNQCLERRRVELRALLDVLRTPEATQVDQVSSAIGSLTPPSACGDAALLAATEPVPDDPAIRAKVSEARAGLARVDALAASGSYKEAAELGKTLSASAASIGYAPLVAEIDGTRGRILIDLNQWDEAKAALDNAQLAAERGRHHYERGNIVLALVYLAMQRNDPAGALVELQKADAIVTGLGGATANRARIADYRSQALAALGKIDEAKAAAETAVALYEEGEGKDTISLSSPLTQLAFVAYQKGDLVTSVKLLERVLQIQLLVFGPDHPRLGNAHTNLAFNLSAADRLDEAQQHAEAAQKIYSASFGDASEPYAEASRALVGILQRRGKLAEAEKLAREVVAKLKEPTPTVRYANALDDLGAAVMAQKRVDEALTLRQDALALREKLLPPGHPSLVSSQIDVADVLADLGRCKEALAIYEAAQKHTDGPEVPPYLAIAARLGRGRCLVETRRQAAAIAPLREALARNEHPDVDDDRKLRAMTNFVLAQALWPADKAGARAAAKAAQAEAGEIHADDLVAALATWVASH